MKAMSKAQVARHAGVTVKTLMNWCSPYREELEALGMHPKTRVLPPSVVKWMVDRFSIDIESPSIDIGSPSIDIE